MSFVFDQQMAAGYDARNAEWAAEMGALHSLMCAVLAEMPANARILCVGVGTGLEILALASAFPGWHFTAVEPSPAMLDICRARMEENGLSARCNFHEGFLETLPASEPFDAATCLAVSHFIMQPHARREFFSQIAQRLRPQGILIDSDISFDLSSPTFEKLFAVWMRKMATPEALPEAAQRMLELYGRQVAVLPPREVESIIAAGGFDAPVPFFQNLLIRAWFAFRSD